jgi:serine/threonine-protein kinase RsbW
VEALGSVKTTRGGPAQSFRAAFPSAYRSVAEARHAATEFAIQCGFSLADVCDIALAVGEACNNAAEHGHVEQGHFSVGCSFDGQALRVQITDNGCGFDLSGKGMSLRIEEPAQRGLGIFIMRALMDDVSYDLTDRGTSVEIVKRLHAKPGNGSFRSKDRG